MRYLRVSATDIDQLRQFMSPPIPEMEMELEELLRRLRKQEPPTEAMKAGTALHKALETTAAGDFSEIESDGYRFSFDFDGAVELSPIREMKATRDYQFGDVATTVVGKVDGIHGRRVDDHKFTSRYDAERFLSSYQWRLYLEIFDADEFRWNVFEGREVEPQTYTITNLHKLGMYRYPGMSNDVERELEKFVHFARQHLPERLT